MSRRAVANYLKRSRLAAGFETQAAFAPVAGLSQQQISNYEKSGRIPQENIPRLAKALGVPSEELNGLLLAAAEEEAVSVRRQLDRAGDFFAEMKVMHDDFREGLSRISAIEGQWEATLDRLNQLVERVEAITDQFTYPPRPV